jgi:hypothetical protein
LVQNSSHSLKIKTGNTEIISNGTIHLTEPEVRFELDGLVIKYKFITDSGEARFSADVIDNEMIISLFNFSNSLGEGLIKPIEIGTLQGKPLLATCYVNTIDANIRQFQYTFMVRV